MLWPPLPHSLYSLNFCPCWDETCYVNWIIYSEQLFPSWTCMTDSCKSEYNCFLLISKFLQITWLAKKENQVQSHVWFGVCFLTSWCAQIGLLSMQQHGAGFLLLWCLPRPAGRTSTCRCCQTDSQVGTLLLATVCLWVCLLWLCFCLYVASKQFSQ